MHNNCTLKIVPGLWSIFFRTINIHTHHSYSLCVGGLCVGVSLCLWGPFVERVITHFIRLFICVFYLSWPLVCGGFVMFVGAFFRTSNHTLHSPVYLCILFVLAACVVKRKFVAACFLEREISPHFIRFWAFLERVITNSSSAYDCFTAVTVRHELSRIVAVRANLATRLGSSRSDNFFRVGV